MSLSKLGVPEAALRRVIERMENAASFTAEDVQRWVAEEVSADQIVTQVTNLLLAKLRKGRHIEGDKQMKWLDAA